MSRSEKQRKGVVDVLAMFAGLDLPVCDDAAAIEAARDAQRATRNRELNSTKGTVAARAQKWFDDVNALLNRRGELLAVVREEYVSLCDAVLRAALDGGRATFGADTRLSLRDLAITWCKARSDLADRWLGEYSAERGLKIGEELDRPEPVHDFLAVPRGGCVQLGWTYPLERCDGVRVVRAPEGSDEGEAVVVYEGDATSFRDRDVQRGARYEYRAYSLFEGRCSLTSVRASGRAPRASAPGTRLAAAASIVVLAALGAVVVPRLDELSALFTLSPSVPAGSLAADEADPGPGHAEPAGGDGDPAPATDPGPGQASGPAPAGDRASPGDGPSPSPATVEPAPPPPLEAELLSDPQLAFAGRSMLLELESSRQLFPQLVDVELEGLALRGVDVSAQPSVIRFSVEPLPPGVLEGTARWSFRVRALDGALSEPFTGRCLVVP